jgi:hypothetical protein
LDRLENGAITAAGDDLHAAHAGLASQITRAVEAVGKITGVYNDAPQAAQNERFSIQIVLPQVGTAPAQRAVIDCTPGRAVEASDDAVSRVTARKPFAVDFGLDRDQE